MLLAPYPFFLVDSRLLRRRNFNTLRWIITTCTDIYWTTFAGQYWLALHSLVQTPYSRPHLSCPLIGTRKESETGSISLGLFSCSHQRMQETNLAFFQREQNTGSLVMAHQARYWARPASSGTGDQAISCWRKPLNGPMASGKSLIELEVSLVLFNSQSPVVG